ncbi:amidohydrolase family protein [Sphingomonas sp. BIUV-7]|uniref:Amidohydrolase family protein n=1 Tax=Sphingomonas natans TaxID=3063330 RepID=A0ABT8Y512_9SPHN|nr:amidohydrolase family protein [Sphingomonas sp. BIUV-7]MDO6413406.1 amidohydrolase family protein [Sphingomonas sp. BIUV-7]
MTLAILNGRIITPSGVIEGGVLCRDGRIEAVGAFDVPADAERIDARGKYVAPGIVDVGVFAIDMPAFVAGGITRALLMPDQSPPLDTVALIQRAAAAGKPQVWIHPLAAATRGLHGTDLAEVGLMARGGATGIATGRDWIADSAVMHRLLSYAGALGLVTVSHAEDGGLARGAVATEAESATRMGLPAAPAEAEALAVQRDLLLAEISGAPLHFRQVTTARALDLIRAAKAKGLPVTCGITPAHFLLSDVAMGDFRTFARLSPPLREEADRLACIAALADGTIDLICSGHDPRGPEAKRLPFSDAEPGMAGAETLLALSLALVRNGAITIERLFQLLATSPAQRFGLPAGAIEPGAEADLLIVDPHAPWRIDSEKLVASAGNTPFDGLPVEGKVMTTIKGGTILG